MEEIDRVCGRKRITKRDIDRHGQTERKKERKKREVVRQREGEEVSQKVRDIEGD